MKKTTSLIFLAVLLFSALALTATVPFIIVQGSTNVSGILTSDATWTKAQSPYNLGNNVLIEAGVTVTRVRSHGEPQRLLH